MNHQRIEITQDRLELKNSWGAQNVITHAFCVITENDHSEHYEISFCRNQISGEIHQVECKPREVTTEHTLTPDAVEELCLEQLQE